MKNGLFVLYKEEGMTSQTAVKRVARLLGTDKAGHTGTLDPMATGILPVLVGRGVKAGEYLLSGNKHYIATLRLGMTTDTEDVTGKILSHSERIPADAEVFAACEAFVGEIRQTPPMYSALKVGGKKLVDLARSGVEIERTPRPVTVFSLTAAKKSDTDYALDVVCSKGTYIRTLCADIGKKLGCGGVMASLCRAEAAGYTLAEAHTLAELEALPPEERDGWIKPVEDLFPDAKKIALPPFYARLARSGVEIYLKKIGVGAAEGDRFRLYDGDVFFALGEVRAFDAGLAVKPVKQFDV